MDSKNLWPGFRALADALRGVAVDREGFEPIDLSADTYWCLGLRGRSVGLLWLRNKADRWDHVLRDASLPPRIEDARIDLSVFGQLKRDRQTPSGKHRRGPVCWRAAGGGCRGLARVVWLSGTSGPTG